MAESSELPVLPYVARGRVISAAEVESVMECLVGGFDDLEKEMMAKDILLQFKEVLVWISPLHQACETSSKILAAATTILALCKRCWCCTSTTYSALTSEKKGTNRCCMLIPPISIDDVDVKKLTSIRSCLQKMGPQAFSL